MAKEKKIEKEQTAEEKLKAALVPKEEWPYGIPENWCYIHLLDSFDNMTDSRKKLKEKDYLKNGKYPIIDQGQALIGGYTNDELLVYSNQLPIIVFGDHTRCVKFIDFNFVQGADGVKLLLPKKIFNSKFFYYALQSIDIPNLGYRRHYPLFKSLFMPLPPVSEQQRIVNTIESLFAKLDEAKEKAQAACDSYEIRKSAILHKAFTGELTVQWRKEHDMGMDSWKKTAVKHVCKDIKVGIVIKPSQYYTDERNGTPAFRSANVREFHIDDFDWVYLNQKGQEENQRSIVHTGDVLVVRSGNPGTACVVDKKYDGYNAIDILIAVPDANIIESDFLCAYTNSPIGRGLVSENKRGMALTHFNVGGYLKLPISLPSREEQMVIVTMLKEILIRENNIKDAASRAIEKIDLIKKSILARAFRGELGTNDPSEESAIELLKQVL